MAGHFGHQPVFKCRRFFIENAVKQILESQETNDVDEYHDAQTPVTPTPTTGRHV